MYHRDKTSLAHHLWNALIYFALAGYALVLPLSHLGVSMPGPVIESIASVLFACDGIYWWREHGAQVKTPKAITLKVLSALPLGLLPGWWGVLGILRMVKLLDLVHEHHLLPRKAKIISIAAGILIATHWIACGWLLVQPRPEMTFLERYVIGVYWAVTTLATVGYGDIVPQTVWARLYAMGTMMMGVSSFAVIVSNFSRLLMKADQRREEHRRKLAGLHQLMGHYQVPLSLRGQIFTFYDHLLAKQGGGDEEKLIMELPPVLQHELQLYIKASFIRDIPVFKNASHEALKTVAGKLRQKFYAPQEIIVRQGEEGAEMFIVAHGEVNVSRDGQAISALKQGQVFGEIALIENVHRTADVVASHYCDLYILSKSDFTEVCAKFPELRRHFEEIYQHRRGIRAA